MSLGRRSASTLSTMLATLLWIALGRGGHGFLRNLFSARGNGPGGGIWRG